MKKSVILFLVLLLFPFSVFALDNDTLNVEDNNLVSIQQEERVLGTTEVTDTGVKEYFIVLLVFIIAAYGIMFVVKKKDLFKTI